MSYGCLEENVWNLSDLDEVLVFGLVGRVCVVIVNWRLFRLGTIEGFSILFMFFQVREFVVFRRYFLLKMIIGWQSSDVLCVIGVSVVFRWVVEAQWVSGISQMECYRIDGVLQQRLRVLVIAFFLRFCVGSFFYVWKSKFLREGVCGDEQLL